ncbi:MAG: cyclase family protein [Myxococcota bacterium]
MARPASLLSILIALAACASQGPSGIPTGRVIDLTHPFDVAAVYWPTAEGFVLETEFQGMVEHGYYYESHRFRASEHGGTHLDAPIHFAEGRQTVDEIPLERLMGPARVVDVSSAAEKDPDYAITRDDLERFEAEHGRIPPGAVVLLRTGFSERWPDRARYLGTEERGPDAVARLHFPGLHPDAARWLLSERDIAAVGLDTASIDPGESTLFESHRVLLAGNVPVFENVAHLGELPPSGAYVIALPMKIGGGSGAPLRIIALLPQPQ